MHGDIIARAAAVGPAPAAGGRDPALAAASGPSCCPRCGVGRTQRWVLAPNVARHVRHVAREAMEGPKASSTIRSSAPPTCRNTSRCKPRPPGGFQRISLYKKKTWQNDNEIELSAAVASHWGLQGGPPPSILSSDTNRLSLRNSYARNCRQTRAVGAFASFAREGRQSWSPRSARYSRQHSAHLRVPSFGLSTARRHAERRAKRHTQRNTRPETRIEKHKYVPSGGPRGTSRG